MKYFTAAAMKCLKTCRRKSLLEQRHIVGYEADSPSGCMAIRLTVGLRQFLAWKDSAW